MKIFAQKSTIHFNNISAKRPFLTKNGNFSQKPLTIIDLAISLKFYYIYNMICPHCHSSLDDKATFCPHCGSDKETGWSEGAEFSDLETPDYNEIVEKEFGKKKANPVAIVAAIVVALAFIAAMVLH
jgi:uncharacterized OB-fold protein